MTADLGSGLVAEEIEATEFAIALLLPEAQVRAYLDAHPGVARFEDQAYRDMAKTFQVPLMALAVRLGDLRKRKP